MELEISVKDAVSGLKSVRVTERKKNAEILKEFLTRNSVPSLLTDNTLKKKGYTWNNLFDDVNEYILKELEKFETSKTFENTIRPLCTSLLHQCMAGSNKGKAYIKTEKIVEMCLYILKDTRMVRAIGDCYLNLLLKHFLPYEHYLYHVTPATWKELLDVCIDACSSNNYNLDTFTKLRLVLLVMKSGKEHCQFVRTLVESLPSLEDHFLNISNDKKVQDVVIEIVTLLLETLSCEYRLTMCQFSETLMPSLLKFYDPNKDQKKKNLFFNFLYLTVILHHPLGRTKNEEGSLANNWELWVKYLNSIMEIICSEVNYLQKNRKMNDRIFQQCSHFYNLAASVHYQIFELSQRSDSNENVSKRLKLSINKNKTFGDLVNELQQNHVPWLGIIHVYVHKYASNISMEDYLLLLNALQVLLMNNTSHLEWNTFEQLACLVLKNCSGYMNQNSEFKNAAVSLWNSCVRNCTSVAPSHKAIHVTMQHLLHSNVLEYADALHLIKLYLSNDMPITNNSVQTLCDTFHKFYSKCSMDDFRVKCLSWLTVNETPTSFVPEISELLFRLIASENISFHIIEAAESESDNIRKILYYNTEKCILFSEFEVQNSIKALEPVIAYEHIGTVCEIEVQVHDYLRRVLVANNARQLQTETDLIECLKLIRICLLYLERLLKYNLKSQNDIECNELCNLLTTTLTRMSVSLNSLLGSNSQISSKLKPIELLRELLVIDFNFVLSRMLRASIDADLFHTINNILNIEVKFDECDIIIDGDQDDINMNTLKHNCFLLLAAYCTEESEYQEELLKLILDENIYNFKYDIPCIFQCIELLTDSKVKRPPLGLIFTLMQHICQKLYKNTKVSYEMLRVLVKIMDPLCVDSSDMKKNCLIMIRSYLQLCDNMYYPPKVAALIYECVTKIVIMNRQQSMNIDDSFEEACMSKMKSSVHSIRLHCCYLLKLINNFSEDDIDAFSVQLLDIFLTDVSSRKESILKDESANRTATVLHAFVALAQSKQSSTLSVILQVIHLQKQKSLDKHLVTKVLKIILNSVGIKDLQTYLNNNILPLIHFWFTKNNEVKDFPVYLLGFDNMDSFIEKHMKWVVTGEILWRQGGNVKSSDILKKVATKLNKSAEHVIETCFSNYMALCMPYIVSAQYNIDFSDPRNRDAFRRSKNNANKMFQMMGEILENESWSNLFAENVGELLLLVTMHMSDTEEAEQIFQVKLPKRNQELYYPKRIFSGILKYFEHLIDGDVLQYLCKDQTVTIFKILFELWKAVTQQSIFELKILALHSYVTFIKNIPLGYPSDAFMCNFACNSFTQAIKHCNNKREMKAYIDGLNLVLRHLLPEKASLMQKSLLELLPALIVKKESDYEVECTAFLNDLVVKMRTYLHHSEDVVDFISSMSQDDDYVRCGNLAIFKEKLKTHRMSLNRPSHDTLLKLRQFLSCNKEHIRSLYDNFGSKTFSEDCETSIIHQIVQALCNILKSNYDDKTIVEACNCLSEISSYDLKTLVTVPPADTNQIMAANATRYFMQVVGRALLEVFFDEDTNVTDEIAETMNDLLKFLRIDDIPELEEIDRDVLKPFSSEKQSELDTVTDSMAFEEYCLSNPEGVFLNSLLTKDSADWLKEVTCTLLQFVHSSTNYVNNLRRVCALKPRLCRKILPALVGLLLQGFTDRHIKAISGHIKKFFNNIWEQTFDEKLENSGDSNFNARTDGTVTHSYKTIIQYMLEIVDFVRIQRKFMQTRPGNAIKRLNYLELDYDKVAWAAAVVDQNWAAVYYGELWAVFQNDGISPNSPEATSRLAGGENLQRIFRTCYVSIGEVDAIEGCGTEHLTMENEKRKHLINTGQFTDALLMHDIALSCGGQADQDLHYGVVKSLHKSGMHHLALSYIKSLPENDQLNDFRYECLAFLGDWSHFVDTRELSEKHKQVNCNQNSVVKAFQYACLKSCLNVQTTPEFENKLLVPMNKAKLAVSRLCHNLNMENCQNIYKVLEKLHIFNDIEDYFSVRMNRCEVSELLQQWDVENLPPFIDFKHIEGLSSQRVLILEHAAKSYSDKLNEIVSLQIQYAQMALNNRRVQMAQRLLAVAKKCKVSEDVTLVESEIAWAKGHKEIALSLLRNIVTNHTLDAKLAATSLRRYALWMAESKRDNPREIIHKYLQKSLDVLGSENIEVRLKVYYDIAKFADAEYKQVVAYMSSSTYENRVKCLENMKGTASSLGNKSIKSLTKEEGKALLTNRKFKELDEAEIANAQVEKDNFLQLAMRYYLLSLKQCDENNLSVFRVISLWLANQDFEFDAGKEKFEDLLNMIPSWKFITVLPQLTPRLTDENTPFITILKNIIKRCAVDHPHHTLPILFGIKNSDKDNVIMNASGRGASSGRGREQQPRVVAAQALVQELRTRTEQLNVIITQMEKMCDAIISFANYVPTSKQKKQQIPSAENIHKLRSLRAVPVPTVTLPILKHCNYEDIPTLHAFDNYFELVGGVNCPKKINCKDNTGKNNIILIKGGDDLKQDAVMQQVFTIVNTLLEKNPVTNKNKLLIRTYKVVPMSRLSGVLEWCEGTIPMGMYLVGLEKNSGAHARYRPQDISSDAARSKMVESANDSHESKLNVYNKIVQSFKPVFHYFFTEQYLDPVTWYERRLAYTKSVATSSMVGYILGLGDRHVYNILIDRRTAEVVHIDLGIAFDQGKTLRTPETVPFRLTRDIIAGFGCSGTEGIFRRCCEKTMQLLRDNQETLLTILEVLLCDPLYSWSVKTAQQNAPTSSRNTSAVCDTGTPSGLAKRALLVVTSKLSGTEDGVAGGVAVAGQVARLLHIATDPFNLCRLFHGWQPYL
ncbi:serine-protein kinase ATM [Spodoptera litura]|uniref:Serine/threonine-protein kinase ATM n=1 Tax=Spodoptera litura TaxID=69820 RepID=A0A9J7ERM6_SPOLT|nr:serine-protein kinase ATM [Spodoptera litura]